jgi:lysozyme
MSIDKYKLICDFEGFRATPYLCSAAVPTIGYGNTFYPDGTKVKMTDKAISREYAFEIFRYICDKFENDVKKLINCKLNNNQLAALLSFTYNVGVGNFKNSTLLKKVNANPNDPTIKDEFMRWTKAGGKEISGLVIRRKKESEVYLTK